MTKVSPDLSLLDLPSADYTTVGGVNRSAVHTRLDVRGLGVVF